MQLVFAEDVQAALNEFNNNQMDALFGNKSDQFYNPDETNESVQSSGTRQQSDESSKNAFLKEPKFSTFWSILLLLFRYCFSWN